MAKVPTSAEQIIADAQRYSGRPIRTLLAALENFYLDGFHDEQGGDAESPTGHFYRVDRWIVITDACGFHSIWPLDSISAARKEFQKLSTEYDKWESEAA